MPLPTIRNDCRMRSPGTSIRPVERATAGRFDAHATWSVMSWLPACAKRPVAWQTTLKLTPLGRHRSWLAMRFVSPYGVHDTMMTGAVGASTWNVSTVTVMAPAKLPYGLLSVPVTLVLPKALPMTAPVALTVATEVLLDVHRAWVVTSWVLPSVNVATAESWRTPPTASVALLIALRVTPVTSGRKVAVTVLLAVIVKEQDRFVAGVQPDHDPNSAIGGDALGTAVRVTMVP